MRHGMVCPFKEGAATCTMSGITGHDNSTGVPLSANTSHNSFTSNCDILDYWILLFGVCRGRLRSLH